MTSLLCLESHSKLYVQILLAPCLLKTISSLSGIIVGIFIGDCSLFDQIFLWTFLTW